MVGSEPAQAWRNGQAKRFFMAGRQVAQTDHSAFVVESDQAAGEKGVEGGHQQKTVEDVQAFGISFTFCPGFGVTGAQNFGQVYAGYGAGVFPVAEQRITKFLLAK